MNTIDSGDTAWLLMSTALVLLMTLALALFYGGMVRTKNVLSTLMHSIAAIPILTVVWILVGYSLTFGASHGGFIGGFEFVALNGLFGKTSGTVPTLAFAAFQMMFAIITPALISGAFAERIKFSAYVIFIVAWSLLVYVPVAHWVWNPDGWLYKLGALDFAGGTVVHATAGVAALVCAFVIGRRVNYPEKKPEPHNLTMTLTGAGMLWFGWFGFNSGSALASGQLAALAFVTTHAGAAGGAIGWMLVEYFSKGRPTALGASAGLVAGLVGVTPAAGFVAPWAALLLGFSVGALCYYGCTLKERFGYDDALDVFGVHGIGGVVGAVLTGVFADKALNPAGRDGLLHGDAATLLVQLLGVSAAALYAGVVTFVILKAIQATVGVRVSEADEHEGLDSSLHGEQGYALDPGAGAFGAAE